MAHFLLLHGACHGGWCWDLVAERLRASGHGVSAPDLPCDSPTAGLNEYADAAVDAVPGRPDDLVIVAHSLAGLTAPIVASRVPARRLVMLAAIVGQPGMSLADLADVDAERDGDMGEGALSFNDDGLFRFTEKAARELLYHDCDEQTAAWATSKLRPQRSMWTQVADFAGWPDTEYVSITCVHDRIVNAPWSDHTARSRLGVEPLHLDSGHSPFLSHPDELVAVITNGL